MTNISLACSPDADDLFMMRALLDGLIDTGPYRFQITTSPTDALNRLGEGLEGPDVLALSIAHYPRVADRYLLLPHGGSVGEGYGPVLVSRTPRTLDSLRGARIAVPGTTTTAATVLRLLLDHEPIVTPISPYSLIFDALRAGEVDAGLIIHEGRLTYEDEGTHLVLDLGVWWGQTHGRMLPLGGNAIRRNLGGETIAEVSRLLRASIAHGLANLDVAIPWLLARGGPLDTPERVRQYLAMYANQRTLDFGQDGKEAVEHLLRTAAGAGLVPDHAVAWAP